MRAYADFSFYKNNYGGTKLGETDFFRLSLRASALIDQITFQRATETEEVKLAVCAAADALYYPGSDNGIASENNDGYAVTYRTRSHEEATREAYSAARLYLPKELTNRGCGE